MSFAGVIFDMDGVLVDSEEFMAEAACRMFAETYRIEVHPDEFFPYRGTGENTYLGSVAAKHGVTIDLTRDKPRAYALFLDSIRSRLKALPGAHDFIATCRSRGLKLAVATSADRMKLEGMLPEIGLPMATFDAIVTGSEVTHKKPSPEIFLAAAGKLGLPAPDCLVIEDAASGVKAAKAAGSRCLALTTSLEAGQLRELGADWVAADLASVPATIWTD